MVLEHKGYLSVIGLHYSALSFNWFIKRIEYKLGVTVCRCPHGRAPRYLADHLIPASDVAPRRRRRLHT